MTETREARVDPSPSEVRTFLIADVRGYTQFTLERGDEAAARLTQTFAQLAREVVTGRTGRVLELRGDEALAVFGSPRQALRAAVELQGRFAATSEEALPLKVGIGLDAGEAVRVEGGYRGAALNLAARLCQLAGPGEVLASEGIVHLARKLDDLEYAERGTVQLKGFADPVKVIEVKPALSVLRDRGRPTTSGELLQSCSDSGEVREEQHLPIGGFLGALPSGALVAREEELRHVRVATDAVVAGQGRTLLLAGEPGVGKTRLAQEVTLHVRNCGFLITAGSCFEARQSVPFYSFLEVLATLYTYCSPDLRRQVPSRWSYLGRLLPDVDIPVPPADDSQAEQERLFRAVAGFMQAVAERGPIALLLDDLHWADGSSLDLLLHLARSTRGHRILILGTYRDVEVGRGHPLEATLRELNRQELVERIAVQRLGEDGTAALLAADLGEARVSDEFTGLLYQRTEGNPFFVQQVLRVLVERGDVFERDGRWTRKDLEEIEVPESIRSVIGQRLSRLSDDTQEALYEGSVLGQSFAFDDLLEMAGREEDALDRALQGACAAGLLRGKADDYAFDHALTQQALYYELSPRRRRRLHLAAGRAIEQLLQRKRGPKGGRRAPELAWHFLQGDDPERALPWALLAGNQAEAVFAHAEAEAQYRTALELARELEDAAAEGEALERLGKVLVLVARYTEALKVLEEAAAIRREGGDREAEARVVSQIGFAHRLRGTAEEGLTRLRAELERRKGDPPSSGLAALYLNLARLHFMKGDAKQELAAAERASEVARAVGDERTGAEAELRRGTSLSGLGEIDEGMRIMESAREVSERVGDLVNVAWALDNLAATYLILGDFHRSLEYQRRYLEASEQIGNPDLICLALAGMGYRHFLLGDWREARLDLDRALEMARSLGPSWNAPYPLVYLGALCMAQGEREEGAAHLRDALAGGGGHGDFQLMWLAHVFLTMGELLEGRAQAASAHVAFFERSMHPGQLSSSWWLLAWISLEIGEEERAESALAAGQQRAGSTGIRLEQMLLAWVRGRLRSRQRRWEAAEESLEEALALARSMPCPQWEAWALLDLGRMHAARGEPDEAHRLLTEALTIFRRLGARPDVERAEQVLAALSPIGP